MAIEDFINSINRLAKLNYTNNGVSVEFSFKFTDDLDNFAALEHIDRLTLAIKALGGTFDAVASDTPVESKPTFQAKCDNCLKVETVTFKPRSDKPFYCNACYSAKRR